MAKRGTRQPAPSNDLIFAACEQFLQQGRTTSQIAEWLNGRGYACSREQVYPLIRLGLKRGFVQLVAPSHKALGSRIEQQFALGDVTVVNVDGEAAFEHVTSAAAERAWDLIEAVRDKKASEKRLRQSKTSGRRGRPRKISAEDIEVHVGLASGRSMLSTARALADRIQAERDAPKLVLHALSPGFDPSCSETAAVSLLALFHGDPGRIERIGLFAEAFTSAGHYSKIKDRHGVRESFEAAAGGAIDIVITSLSSSDDVHSTLREYFGQAPEDLRSPGVEVLEENGWIGDILFRPYNEERPITAETAMRAISVLEIEDLIKMVRQNKHVLLVATPCRDCGMSKVSALRPLLTSPDLKVANHLVLDARSAEELLGLRSGSGESEPGALAWAAR
jgi:hypothetical protein